MKYSTRKLEKVIKIDKVAIGTQLDKVVRSTVEEMLN